MTFEITTPDPRFDPRGSVIINGHTFAPADDCDFIIQPDGSVRLEDGSLLSATNPRAIYLRTSAVTYDHPSPVQRAAILTPCPNPWCGSLEIVRVSDLSDSAAEFRMCVHCSVQSPPGQSPAEADAIWNARGGRP